MGEAQFPQVPAVVSAVSSYTGARLDTMPYEEVDHAMRKASEAGDWAAAEVLGYELDRRESLPVDQLSDAEEQRWQNLSATQRRQIRTYVDPADPRTHPMARRGLMSVKDREKSAQADYVVWTLEEIDRASEATKGNLFNRRGQNAAVTRGVTAAQLWTNKLVAQAYASEELRAFWRDNPRLTFAAFKEWTAGRFGEARESVDKDVQVFAA